MKPTVIDTEFAGAADIDWIALPEGFAYAVIGVAGDMMSDGLPTPTAHDGMAAFPAPRGRVRLVRNHEIRDGSPATPISPRRAYDPLAGAGCTTLQLRFDGGLPVLERDFVSLNGTAVNCAGGLTPWGSWLSSEETTETRDETHGWNFEVPSGFNGVVKPLPLKAMGRFDHEAVCIDPASGIVYETEDDGDSGFYQFVPDRPGDLAAGGKLQMLKVARFDNAILKTGIPSPPRPIRVEWVDIDDPETLTGTSVKDQGLALGAALFGRLEGCWFGNGSVFFNCTDGGDAGEGQVWEYRPTGKSGGFLRLTFESPGGHVLSAPDNICVSPRGGMLLCEDHGFDRPDDPFAPLPNVDPSDDDAVEVQYVKGLTRGGRIFDFAANLLDDKEWAGACFSPDGNYLFVNTQGATSGFDPGNPADHGRTFVIWGPWESGAL